MPISLNLNVDKVDKRKFVTGKKGRYLDLVLYETPESEWGDYLVKQRGEKGERMVILGNAKYYKPAKKEEPKTDVPTAQSTDKDPW